MTEYVSAGGVRHSITDAQSLVEIVQTPACILDGAGELRYLNSAWREYRNIPDISHYVNWPRLICPEDFSAVMVQIRSAITTMSQTNIECRLLDGRGAVHWFLLSMQPLNKREAGEEGSWLCIGADIHNLKLSEINLRQHESIQTDMLNVSVDCIKLIALDGTVIYMNRAGCRALGVPEESSFGMQWLPLLPKDVWEHGERALSTAKAGIFARFAGRSVIPLQNVKYWDNMLTPVMDANGLPTAILCVSRDVTAEREAVEALRESRERLEMAVRVGGLGVWDYDIQSDKLHCDETWYRIMGRDPAHPVRSITEFRKFIHPEDVDRATEVNGIASDLIATNRDYSMTFRIVHPSGGVRWVRSAACVLERDGNPTRAVGFVTDVTDSHEAELALHRANRTLEEERAAFSRQSLEDPLTEIANRRHLDGELARLHARVSETNEPICVGMIDVDHFKAYNDRYGHIEGDIALRKVARALQSILRKSDFIARYGGEEFAFILVNLTDPAPLLDRLMTIVEELGIRHEASPSGYLSISCGCVVFDSNERLLPQQLLKLSDGALYEAKIAGRNRYVIRTL
ncbi:diguanylate cyclase [Phyllobacterium sp. 0TCS1.6C]|uniref:sensor domain-containing diguanylate cyclase n=1 Tax=unclassified Phyllobacterium TaxID=2638441 RepID=UPI002264C8B7|nr:MULTISPECIES: diguanylate cyclase [unclassified Phyllobacterium]MCX8282495.1 diguanylate cyclase [Phyllobacterium sp. 0TCS1.6C]MCX8292587.1 diguanylate cyclase [Phyllobacterium sp. 0TCS1.6A]